MKELYRGTWWQCACLLLVLYPSQILKNLLPLLKLNKSGMQAMPQLAVLLLVYMSGGEYKMNMIILSATILILVRLVQQEFLETTDAFFESFNCHLWQKYPIGTFWLLLSKPRVTPILRLLNTVPYQILLRLTLRQPTVLLMVCLTDRLTFLEPVIISMILKNLFNQN